MTDDLVKRLREEADCDAPTAERVAALEPGSPCPCDGCDGFVDVAPSVNCSCHIDAPCSACTNAGLLCNTCGWDSTPERTDWVEEFERRDAERRAEWSEKRGARRHQFTSTHTDNPFNSTPFTRCCGIAAINTNRCPHCEAEITHHEGGLAARRREVGPGNCLMCGKRQGDPAISGNCHC